MSPGSISSTRDSASALRLAACSRYVALSRSSATRWEARNFSSFAYPSVTRLTGVVLWPSPTPEVPGRADDEALAGRVAAARDPLAAGWAFELDPALAAGWVFELTPAFVAWAFELDPAFAKGRDLVLAAAFFAGARCSDLDLSAVLDVLAALAAGAGVDDLRDAPAGAGFCEAGVTVFEATFEPACEAAFFGAPLWPACAAERVCF